MAIMDVLYSKAATEKDHRVATYDLLHGVLDAVMAAANADMNEVRKVVAQLREYIPRLSDAVVAEGRGPMPDPTITPAEEWHNQSARRLSLQNKPDRTGTENAELDRLNMLADPMRQPPLTAEGIARRDELRAKSNRTNDEDDELAKLEAPIAGDPGGMPKLSIIEVTRRDELRRMPNRSPAIEAELASLEQRSEPPPDVVGAEASPPAGWTPPNPPKPPAIDGYTLSDGETKRRDELLAKTPLSDAERAELDTLDAKADQKPDTPKQLTGVEMKRQAELQSMSRSDDEQAELDALNKKSSA